MLHTKGPWVAAAGFTPAAKTRATKAGVDLYRLIDAESHEWQTLVSIPALVDDRSMGAFNAQLAGDLTMITKEQVADFGNIEIYQADGSSLGKIGYVVNQAWNRGDISHEPGRHTITLADGDTHVRSGSGLHRLTVVANVEVVRTLYFGRLPLTEIKGLHNEVTGVTATRRIQTDWLDHRVVQRTWQQLTSLDELAVQPVLTFEVSSHYDESPQSVAT